MASKKKTSRSRAPAVTLYVALFACFISSCSKKDDAALDPAGDSSTKVIGRAPAAETSAQSFRGGEPARVLEVEPKPGLGEKLGNRTFTHFEEKLASLERDSTPTPSQSLELEKIIRGLSRDDLELALDLALKLRRPALKSEALSIIFTRWAEIDPEAAISRAENLEDEQSKLIAVRGAIVTWAENDPESAWHYATQQKSGLELSRMLSAIVSHIAQTAPQKAISLASRVEDVAARNLLYQSISWNWAGKDPKAVLEWIDTLDDPWMNRQARPNVLGILAVKDPQAALDLAMDEPDPQSRGEALNRILHQLADRDENAAYTILRNLQPEDFSESFIRTLGHALSYLEVEQVVRNIAHLGPEVTNNYLASTAQVRIKQGAVEDALSLLTRLPDGALQLDAYSSFASTWAAQDSLAASRWLDGLSPGNKRDSAIEGFSYSIMATDPEAALIWAGAVEEPGKQKYLVRRLASQWIKKDDASARAWINRTDALDFETRQELLRIPTNRP